MKSLPYRTCTCYLSHIYKYTQTSDVGPRAAGREEIEKNQKGRPVKQETNLSHEG